MCGRYTLSAPIDELVETFDVPVPDFDLPPRYNIAPSQPIAVITNQNPKHLDFFKWGLIPSWSKDPAIGNRLLRLFVELNRLGTSVIIATHDYALMEQLEAPRLMLYEGQLQVSGP